MRFFFAITLALLVSLSFAYAGSNSSSNALLGDPSPDRSCVEQCEDVALQLCEDALHEGPCEACFRDCGEAREKCMDGCKVFRDQIDPNISRSDWMWYQCRGLDCPWESKQCNARCDEEVCPGPRKTYDNCKARVTEGRNAVVAACKSTCD